MSLWELAAWTIGIVAVTQIACIVIMGLGFAAIGSIAVGSVESKPRDAASHADNLQSNQGEKK